MEIDFETLEMQSDLELMVNQDMMNNGLDPYRQKDVETYWKERLDDN